MYLDPRFEGRLNASGMFGKTSDVVTELARFINYVYGYKIGHEEDCFNDAGNGRIQLFFQHLSDSTLKAIAEDLTEEKDCFSVEVDKGFIKFKKKEV